MPREKASTFTLPDWLLLPEEGLTAEIYDALPKEIRRRIEVVDGAVVVRAAPPEWHERLVRNLAEVLRQGLAEDEAVGADMDVRLSPVLLTNFRPDVVIYDASVPNDTVLGPEHCRLVVEVVTLNSMGFDRILKPNAYASVGVPEFWRVENFREETRTACLVRHRLDGATGEYAVSGARQGRAPDDGHRCGATSAAISSMWSRSDRSRIWR